MKGNFIRLWLNFELQVVSAVFPRIRQINFDRFRIPGYECTNPPGKLSGHLDARFSIHLIPDTRGSDSSFFVFQ
jgi:hypothetical protein